MLPALAFVLLHAGTAQRFIDECTQAVLGTKEGVWGMVMRDSEGKLQRKEAFQQGGVTRLKISVDGTIVQEALIGPISTLVVYPLDKKYSRTTYPAKAKEAKPEPLKPLGEGEMEFKIGDEWGFILRANPEFTNGVIVKGDTQETLTASSRKANGREAFLTLVRDTKTRFPLSMKVVTPDDKTDIRFLFEARKVKDEELKIAPSTYQGFEEIKSGSGTL